MRKIGKRYFPSYCIRFVSSGKCMQIEFRSLRHMIELCRTTVSGEFKQRNFRQAQNWKIRSRNKRALRQTVNQRLKCMADTMIHLPSTFSTSFRFRPSFSHTFERRHAAVAMVTARISDGALLKSNQSHNDAMLDNFSIMSFHCFCVWGVERRCKAAQTQAQPTIPLLSDGTQCRCWWNSSNAIDKPIIFQFFYNLIDKQYFVAVVDVAFVVVVVVVVVLVRQCYCS